MSVAGGMRLGVWACAAGLTLAIFALPVQIHPDSATYLGHAQHRPPLYPYILDLFRAAFGEPDALAWVARLQVLAIAGAALLFSCQLTAMAALPALATPVLYLLLVLPGLKFATAILTEPLCYALLLLFWSRLVLEASRPEPGRNWALPALAATALLLRPQFLFLPVFLAVYYLVGLAGKGRRQAAKGLLLLALCLGVSFGLRGLENAQRHGSFAAPSSGAAHLLATLAYVAVPGDERAFADEERRGLLREIVRRGGERGLTQEHWGMSRDHYDTSLNQLEPLVEEVLALHAQSPDRREPVSAERLAGSMAVSLLTHMPLRYLGLLARKFYDGQPFYYALVAMAGVLGAVHARRSGGGLGRLLWLAALHSWLSYGVVLATGAYGLRYLMPAEMIFLAVALAVGLRLVWSGRSSQAA